VIKSYPIPKCAHMLASRVYSNRVPDNKAGTLMMLGNFLLAVVIPIGTIIYIHGDCFGGWMQLWSRCQRSDSFDTSVQSKVGTFEYESTRYWDVNANRYSIIRQVQIAVNVTITKHGDICQPAYIADGRCPRALIGALGNLYVRDLCFSVGLGAVFTFLRASPWSQRAKRWFVRTVLRRSAYVPRTSPDRMVTSAVLLLELPLILGFCYPVLPALAAIAMLLSSESFNISVERLGVKLTDDPTARVSIKYLFGSLGLGYAITLWLFVEGDFAGKWLVAFGWPLCTFVLAAIWIGAQKSQDGDDLTPHEKYMYKKYTHRPGRRKSLLHVDDVRLWAPYHDEPAFDGDGIVLQKMPHNAGPAVTAFSNPLESGQSSPVILLN